MTKLFLLIAFLSLNSWGWTHLTSNTSGWDTRSLTFYVNTTNCSVPDAQLFQMIDTAISVWNGVPTTNLKLSRSETAATDTEAMFKAGTATQVPLIVCSKDFTIWGSENASEVPGFMPLSQSDSSGHVNYSGLVLNSTGQFADLSLLTNGQVELVLAHEMGHVLGLGHSGDPNALMYYSIGNKTDPILTQDDEDGITQLYPRSEFSGGAMGCSAVHQRTTTVPILWLGLWILGLTVTLYLGRCRLSKKDFMA